RQRPPKSTLFPYTTLFRSAKKLKQQLDAGDFKELRQQWEQKEAYVADAFKLVANPNLCVKCHQVGTVPVEQIQGPTLAISAERRSEEHTSELQSLAYLVCR